MTMPRRCWPVLGILAALACGRDAPPVTTGSPPGEVAGRVVRTSGIVAGGGPAEPAIRNPYEGDENAMAQGERYYTWFNCAECHGARGGGGMGPPFADSDWIYGDEPANIFQSIVQGRPNGMPSFAGKIPDDQVWKIVLYVRSLPGRAGAGERQGGGESGSLEGRPQDRRAASGGGGAQ